MNLELKHLAAYLPYKLRIDKIDCVLFGISNDYALLINAENQIHANQINALNPILRTLLDLTKEIEINGEKFVPFEKIFSKKPERDILFERVQTESFLNSGLYRFVEYQYIEKLLSWHFDIFGLIDAGLAIDINTLKNNTDGSTLLQP